MAVIRLTCRSRCSVSTALRARSLSVFTGKLRSFGNRYGGNASLHRAGWTAAPVIEWRAKDQCETPTGRSISGGGSPSDSYKR
jgi:hypothetical protein